MSVKHNKLSRNDVIGQRITAIRCKSEILPDGFRYVEAVLILENGLAFPVNEVGVDEPSELSSCDAPGECSHEVSTHVADMIGRTITNVVVADSIPTLVVLSDRRAIFGMDTGPPFNGFAPTISLVGEYIDDNEIVDFWSRDSVAL